MDAPQRAARIELRLDALDSADGEPSRRAAAASAAHEAHSLLGAAGTVGFEDVAAAAGELEDTLRTVDPGIAAPAARSLLAEVKAAIAAVEGETARITVLHVEDNPLNARLVERTLARRPGVRLMAATDGETALHLARERRPELILLDLNLPGMSGVEVLRRLRDEPATRDLAVVVVTAHDPARTSQRLRDLEIREYLPKPIVVARLLELVEELAGQAGEP